MPKVTKIGQCFTELLDWFAVGLRTCTAVARSLCVSYRAFLFSVGYTAIFDFRNSCENVQRRLRKLRFPGNAKHIDRELETFDVGFSGKNASNDGDRLDPIDRHMFS